MLEPHALVAGNPEKEVPGVTLAVTGLVYQLPVGEEATSGAGSATEAMVGVDVSTWSVYRVVTVVEVVPFDQVAEQETSVI